MKQIWYYSIKAYTKVTLFLYFKKIKVIGKEHIPKKGALLFVSNHKNALIDPILIAINTTRDIYFLTRASAFKIKFVKWLLSTINMLPIYRIRDGKEALAKNDEVFKKCFDILNKKKTLLIFPEGTHDIRRWVRPLSKGFTRITFGALAQNPNLDLTIVPVGLNYSKAENFAESVAIIYGKPIVVNTFYDAKNINASSIALKEKVRTSMQALTTHIEDIENYDSILNQLGTIDYLDPIAVNKKIEKLSDFKVKSQKSKAQVKPPNTVWKVIYNLMKLNSIFPILIWNAIKPNIKELEFYSTTRYALGVTAFPICYFLQTLAVNYFFNTKIALMYLGISIVLVLFLAKNK